MFCSSGSVFMWLWNISNKPLRRINDIRRSIMLSQTDWLPPCSLFALQCHWFCCKYSEHMHTVTIKSNNYCPVGVNVLIILVMSCICVILRFEYLSSLKPIIIYVFNVLQWNIIISIWYCLIFVCNNYITRPTPDGLEVLENAYARLYVNK